MVPFGLKNAPPYFQRRMYQVFQNLPFGRCYINDIIVSFANMEEHLKHLAMVSRRLQKSGL